MKNILRAFAIFSMIPISAFGQGLPAPQVQTQALGTSNNAAASTAFVQNQLSSGSAIIVPGQTGLVCSVFGAYLYSDLTHAACGRPLAVNAASYGVLCNDFHDDSPAFQNAIDAAASLSPAGEVVSPSGVCRISTKLQINSSITFSGQGSGQTSLQGDLALPTVMQIGDATHAPGYVRVKALTITRAAGSVPAGSRGLYWATFNYGSEDDVVVSRHDFGRDLECLTCSGSVSVGYTANNVYGYGSLSAYMKIGDVAGVFITNSQWGKNGGDGVASPTSVIQISGQANDIHFNQCDLVPQGSSGTTNAAIGFVGYLNTTGIIELNSCVNENTAYSISSDAATPTIPLLSVIGGRYAPTTAFLQQNAATQFQALVLSAPIIQSSVTIGPNFLTNIAAGTYIQNDLTVIGSSLDFTSSGALIAGNVNFSGTFSTLAFNSNVLGSYTDTSTATTKRAGYSGTGNYILSNAPTFSGNGQWNGNLAFGQGDAVVFQWPTGTQIGYITSVDATHIQLMNGAASGKINIGGANVVGLVVDQNGADALSYKVGGVTGVSCSGSPTGSFAVTNGIVTHC